MPVWWRLVALLSLTGCLPGCLLGQTPDAILKAVDTHYNRLSSLQARYTERYTGMGMDRTESGTLLLKKPGRMRWSYDTPAGKLFLLDGKHGWFYTPGDPQAQRVSAKQLDDLRSPLRFLLGHTELHKELVSISIRVVAGGYEISGVPTGLAQRVRMLSLTVNGTGSIQAMRLEEVDGTTTSFTFSEQREDAPAKDADFRFAPPPGVTIVDGLPPM